ncbi:MAG: carboxyl transferase domain-containing protein, partial [Candidatus Aquilonibacter sp.]
ISVMGGPQAAGVLSSVKGEMTAQEKATFEAPILEKYDHEGSPYYSTARLWDDGIIDPLDTRHVIAMGLDAAANAPLPPTHFGIFRM